MEGDPCKFSVWTGRAPLSDHRVVMKSLNLDVKQLWVKKIRELIQEKYFYMEVAMCETGHQSNRNSKDFEMDSDFLASGAVMMSTPNGHHMLMENLSSAASNASSGTKVSDWIIYIPLLYLNSIQSSVPIRPPDQPNDWGTDWRKRSRAVHETNPSRI